MADSFGFAAGVALGPRVHLVHAGQEINNAIARASDNDVIWLAPGTHEITQHIAVTKPLTIMGCGRHATKIRVADGARATLTAAAGSLETDPRLLTVDDTAGFEAGQVVSIQPVAYDATANPPVGYQTYDMAVIASVDAEAGTITLTADLTGDYSETVTEVVTAFSAIELGIPVPGIQKAWTTSTDRVTIRDLEIDGNAANQVTCSTDEYQNGIHMAGSFHVMMENLYIHDTPFMAIGCSHRTVQLAATPDDDDTMTTASAHGLRLHDPVTFVGTANGVTSGQTYYVRSVVSTTKVTLAASLGTGITAASVVDLTTGAANVMVIDLGSRDIQIRRCQIDDQLYRGSIHFHGTQDVVINDCRINSSKDLYYGAIFCTGATRCYCQNIKVRDCDITGAYEGIVLSGRNVSAVNNNVHDTGWTAIRVYDAAAVSGSDAGHPAVSALIEGNTINRQTTAACFGIHIDMNTSVAMFDGVIIANNVLIDCQYCAIKDEGRNTIIRGNQLLAKNYLGLTTDSGITTTAADSLIEGNYIDYGNRRGIVLASGALRTQVLNNRCVCSGNNAIKVASGASAAIISGNHVVTSADEAFELISGGAILFFGVNTQLDGSTLYTWGLTQNTLTRA